MVNGSESDSDEINHSVEEAPEETKPSTPALPKTNVLQVRSTGEKTPSGALTPQKLPKTKFSAAAPSSPSQQLVLNERSLVSNEMKRLLELFDGNVERANNFLGNFCGSVSCAMQFIAELDSARDAENLLSEIDKDYAAGTDNYCGDCCKWIFDEKTKTLFIRGSGAMNNYEQKNGIATTPWTFHRNVVERIVISDGITSIGDYAFFNFSSVKLLIFPESVTRIGERAISRCPSCVTPESLQGDSHFVLRESVLFTKDMKTLIRCPGDRQSEYRIPDGVEVINGGAFEGCSRLESVVFPKTVRAIGKFTFSGCPSLRSFKLSEKSKHLCIDDGILFTKDRKSLVHCPAKIALTKYTIPKNVTEIREYAFSECSSLTSIALQKNVTVIGGWCFFGCTKLASIAVPKKVKAIGTRAFAGCPDLSVITVDKKNECFKSIGNVLFTRDGTKLIRYASAKPDKSYNVPNGVLTLADCAFDESSHLKSVTIPESVVLIGDWAFYSCTALESVKISSSVTTIGDSTFESCTSLVSVKIPNSVTAINERAFRSCSSLEAVGLSEGVTSIGKEVFSSCSALKSIHIPDSVTAIGEGAFDDCSSLTTLEIPDSVNDIGGYCFFNCSGLTSITIPSSVSVLNPAVLCGCSALTSIAIPRATTAIERYALCGCSSLRTITIPKNVKKIGQRAFTECMELSTVIVDPQNAHFKTVDNVLFTKDGTRLLLYPIADTRTSYSIPEGVVVVADSAFDKCNLKAIALPSSVKTVESGSFSSCYSLAAIETSTENPNFVSSDGILFSKDKKTLVCYPAGRKESGYAIQNSIATIGDYAFCGSHLKSVSIPSSVKKIGADAFWNCSLTSVVVPKSVAVIEANAFECCSSLLVATLPKRFESRKDDIFNRCKKIRSINWTE